MKKILVLLLLLPVVVSYAQEGQKDRKSVV